MDTTPNDGIIKILIDYLPQPSPINLTYVEYSHSLSFLPEDSVSFLDNLHTGARQILTASKTFSELVIPPCYSS